MLKLGVALDHIKISTAVTIVISLAVLPACAPKNIKDLKGKNLNNKHEFIVNDNYQPVHRKLLDQAKECWSTYLLTAQYVVQNELYPDTKTATISSEFHSAFGTEVYKLIEIREISEKQTQVITYWHRGNSEKLGEIVKRWAINNSTSCS